MAFALLIPNVQLTRRRSRVIPADRALAVVVITAAIDHTSADLVTKRERQIVLGADTVIVIAEVGVADAAAGDLDDDFVGAGRADVEFHRDHRFARGGHHPPNGFDAHLTALRIGL